MTKNWEANIRGKGMVCFNANTRLMENQNDVAIFLAFSKEDNSPVIIWINLVEWDLLCEGEKGHWYAFNRKTFFTTYKRDISRTYYNEQDQMVFLEELAIQIWCWADDNTVDGSEGCNALDKLATFYDELPGILLSERK